VEVVELIHSSLKVRFGRRTPTRADDSKKGVELAVVVGGQGYARRTPSIEQLWSSNKRRQPRSDDGCGLGFITGLHSPPESAQVCATISRPERKFFSITQKCLFTTSHDGKPATYGKVAYF
jgi:hypothetical protein